MSRTIGIALGLLLLGISGASAASLSASALQGPASTVVHKAHSLGKAEHTLRDLGYYDIQVERSSLPYSFNACKRGVRYHVHMNYYGDLEQVDELGRCRDYDDDYGYRSRSRYPRYGY